MPKHHVITMPPVPQSQDRASARGRPLVRAHRCGQYDCPARWTVDYPLSASIPVVGTLAEVMDHAHRWSTGKIADQVGRQRLGTGQWRTSQDERLRTEAERRGMPFVLSRFNWEGLAREDVEVVDYWQRFDALIEDAARPSALLGMLASLTSEEPRA